MYKDDNRIIEVINKIDTVTDINNFHNQINKNSIMISAKNKTGINLLMRTIKDKLKKSMKKPIFISIIVLDWMYLLFQTQV